MANARGEIITLLLLGPLIYLSEYNLGLMQDFKEGGSRYGLLLYVLKLRSSEMGFLAF